MIKLLYAPVVDEQDKETSDSMKSGEFIDQLSDCWLFKVKYAQ
jgi:hypothetical protein